MGIFKRIKHFFNTEIWSADLNSKSRRRIFLIRQIRIFVFAFKGFFEDRAALRATSLTYFTMLSIIPIFAMAFGIANGFGFEDKLNQVIDSTFSRFEHMVTIDTGIDSFSEVDSLDLSEMDSVFMAESEGQLSDAESGPAQKIQSEKITSRIKSMVADLLNNTKGGLMAGVGFIILFWSVIQVLNNIELSFNDIWQVKKSRSPLRKFSDYLALMILAPFAITLAGSVTVRINQAANNLEIIQPIIKLIPYASISLLFTIVYIVMPNTKVKPKYALIAGVVAGTLSVLWQWGYVEFQVGVTRLNTLYGSFAAIPLFLLYIQITWLIVLMGAEISFAYQNIENYEYEADALNLNHDNKRILSLAITQHVVNNFADGGAAKTNEQISHELGIPLRLLNELVFELTECGVLAELASDNSKERRYQPAMDINKLSVNELYTRLEKLGSDQMIVTESENIDKITKIHEHLMDAMRESPSNILIREI